MDDAQYAQQWCNYLGEAISPFSLMLKNIAGPMEKLRELKSPFVEVQDLLATGSALGATISSINEAGSSVNLATLYDSVSTIGALSRSVLMRFDSTEVKTIAEETQKTASTVRKQISFDQANSRLFEYYKDLADLTVISGTIREVCEELSKSEKPESLWGMIKRFFEDLKSKTNLIVHRLKEVIGVIGQELISAVEKISETLEKELSKFAERLREATEKLHQFVLNLIRKMFSFLGEVQEIAEENKWQIREIVVEMPSCDVDVISVACVPIAVPKINTPKLTIVLAPSVQKA